MSEGEPVPAARPRKSRLKGFLLGTLAVLAFLVSYTLVWSHLNFPYGATHACSKVVSADLQIFAEENGHWYPHGESTPEASLGLLYTNDIQGSSYMLAGKTLSKKVVQAKLKQYGKISPETCDWHYVEGLRDDDDPQIILVWDKAVGLSHNGQREDGLMHEVIYVGGFSSFINKEHWPLLMAEEKKKLAELAASRQSNAPPIRWSDEESLGPNRINPK